MTTSGNLRTQRCSGPPADELLAQRVHVWHLIPIREERQSVPSDDCIDFSLRLTLDFGMHSHCQEERGQGVDRL